MADLDVHNWFPTAIGSTMFENKPLLDKMVDRAYEIRNSFESTHAWGCSTYASFGVHNLTSDSEFSEATDAVTQAVISFANHHAARLENIACTEAWYNIAKTGDYQEYHNHPNHHFSAVLYLKTPENCGKIVFQSPSHGNMLPIPLLENNEANFQNCYYTPSPGLIVCFCSNLYHMVEQNKSNDDRISAAYNFRLNENLK